MAHKGKSLLAFVMAVVATGAGLQAPATAAVWKLERVEVINQLPGGITEMIEYIGGPGVSREELRASLRAGGQLTAANDASTMSPPEECGDAWGTARLVSCSYPRWKKNSQGQVIIVMNDLTGAAWPVGAATTDWNNRVQMHVLYNCTTNNQPGRHCVTLDDYDFRTDGNPNNDTYVGMTYRYWSGTSPYVYFNDTAYTMIWFNTKYNSSSYSMRRQVTCHEIGHALGLGHNVGSNSCLQTYIVDGGPASPNGDDVALTNWLHFNYMPI